MEKTAAGSCPVPHNVTEVYMKRIFALVLSLVIILGSFALCSGAADKYYDSGIDYTESLETFYDNPARGQAGYSWYRCYNDAEIAKGRQNKPNTSLSGGLYCPFFDLSSFSAGNHYPSGSPGNAVDRKAVGGKNIEINQSTLDMLDAMLAAARQHGSQFIIRFSYDRGGAGYSGGEPGAGLTSAEGQALYDEEYKKVYQEIYDKYINEGKNPVAARVRAEKEGAEQAKANIKKKYVTDYSYWVETHIKQLCTVLNKYPDTILAIGCGIVGPWGEMHTSYYDGADVLAMWDKYLDSEIGIQMRSLGPMLSYMNTTDIGLIKNPVKYGDKGYRVGMWNDGYLGTDSDYGSWGSGSSPSRTNGVKILKEHALRVPYGGELAYCDAATVAKCNIIHSTDLVKELYDTHLNYLHNIAGDGNDVTKELKKITFNASYYYDGLPDVSAYYGQTMQKFMLDHMGYRFVLRKSENTKTANRGDTVSFSGRIENVGFGNLMVNTVNELIVVAPDGTKSVVKTLLDPTEWMTAKTTSFNITLSVPQTSAQGKYDVYLRFATVGYEDSDRNTVSVRFANKDTWNSELGANYIGSFDVLGVKGGYAEKFEQINTGSFTDVRAKDWFADAVDFVTSAAGKNIMKGMGGGLFAPNGTTTRGQLVTVLYNMESQPDVSGIKTPFTDVKSSKYYAKPIAWAYANNIVKGMSDTEFSPEGLITREQFSAILYRYSQYKSYDTSKSVSLDSYPDASSVSKYARTSMAWANAEGLITGTTFGAGIVLNPQGTAIRAQMAQIMTRFIRLCAN